jgi:murein DD-endopeptidase MepM/ murein hydrolase activator NlpD
VQVNLALLLIAALLLGACQPQVASFSSGVSAEEAAPQETVPAPEVPLSTPLPTRPVYSPGELVDYTAQTGDTLPVLAVRFNTTLEEIRQANTFIPQSATTMPPGMPMKIPIYYTPFWGTPFRIIPDSLFINGPAQVGFDTGEFIASQPGWLNGYQEYAADANRNAAQIIDLVALKFSISPRLILALLEYQSGALTRPEATAIEQTYPLGFRSRARQGLYPQLLWAANLLNNGYYPWRTGNLTSIEYSDGRQMRFDPWQNAATVSLHNFFNAFAAREDYDKAISPDGLALTYASLFGDPWAADQPHIPGSLEQPSLRLPFRPGEVWAHTGGPHTAWGNGAPFAALDFAPPLIKGGCTPTERWVTAVASGVVARSEFGEVVLDLDGDGDERTGWNIFYLHVATEGRAPLGAVLQAGDPVGYPSCEGGSSTGTHVHIARKYNGEWVSADWTLPFVMEDWVPHNGSAPYLGTLTRQTRTVTACDCSNQGSFIESEPDR